MSTTAIDVRSGSEAGPGSESKAETGTGAVLSIGQLSARTGVSHRSLRYYEQQGLLTAERTGAGHRRFDAEAVDRVLLTQRLVAAGLSSREIAPLLPGLLGRADHDGRRAEALIAHRDRLLLESARLRDTAEILDEVIDEYGGTGGS